MNAESMANTLKIAGEEMPGFWAAGATYAITKANTPFLLIVAEREDHFLDAILYQRGNAGLLAQAKIPLQIRQCVVDKLTGAFLQQISLRRKMAPGKEGEVLRDFSLLFKKSDEMQRLFTTLAQTVSGNGGGLTFPKIQPIFREIVQNCEMDLGAYPQILRKKGVENTMMQLYASMLMEWNNLSRMLQDFMKQQEIWVNERNADMQIHFCGSIRILAALAEPSAANKPVIQMSPTSRETLYRMTAEMLRIPEKKYPWRLQMSVYAGDYEKMMVEGYRNYQSRTVGTQEKTMQSSTVGIFQEQVLCLPENFCIYAGSTQGKQLPLNGRLVQKSPVGGNLLVAPFSDAFSTLIAEGRIVLQQMQWEVIEESLRFTVEFSYDGRTYKPRPRLYGEESVLRVTEAPEVILFRTPGRPEMHVRLENSVMRTALFHGKQNGKAIMTETGNFQYYFKLYKDDNFVGQFDYLLAKGVNAGNE